MMNTFSPVLIPRPVSLLALVLFELWGVGSPSAITVVGILGVEDEQHTCKEGDGTLETTKTVAEMSEAEDEQHIHKEDEGEPTESHSDLKKGNISHLVHATISPIIGDFRHKTGHTGIQH